MQSKLEHCELSAFLSKCSCILGRAQPAPVPCWQHKQPMVNHQRANHSLPVCKPILNTLCYAMIVACWQHQMHFMLCIGQYSTFATSCTALSKFRQLLTL